MSEEAFEETLITKARQAGYITRKVAWQGRRAAPDRVFFGHGRCVWLELKKPGKELDPLQARERKKLKRLYEDIHWTDNLGKALEILGINT